MSADSKDLTKNKFLGNKIEIFQFPDGYRGNMDSVLMAASVTAKKRPEGVGIRLRKWGGIVLSVVSG